MSSIESSLKELESRLDEYQRFESYLGKDFERPIQSLKDGYPEMTVSLVGIILESILKFIWEKEGISGDPSRRTLHDLLQACSDYIDSRQAYDYMIDLQRLRNRAVHDVSGDSVSRADAIDALRKLIRIFEWFKSHVSGKESDNGEAEVDSEISKKSKFVSDFSEKVGYKTKESKIISENTIYKLFEKKQGIRYAYLELVISNSKDDLKRITSRDKNPFIDTSYPKHSRYIITGFGDADRFTSRIQENEPQVGGISTFIDDFFDYEKYVSDVLSQGEFSKCGSSLNIGGKILEYSHTVQDFTVSDFSKTESIREEVIDSVYGNLLVLGEPGGGKTHFCRSLLQDFMSKRSNNYAFYFDLGNAKEAEKIEDFITRKLEPYIRVPKHNIINLYNYVSKKGYVLTVFDGFDHLCHSSNIDEILSKFSDLAKFFSQKSRVVLSSRTSFFADTKHMRELLHKDAIVSDRVSDGLTNVGIDPLQLPNFTVLKLDLATAARNTAPAKISRALHRVGTEDISFTPLVHRLISDLTVQDILSCFESNGEASISDAKIVYKYVLNTGLGNLSEDDFSLFVSFFSDKFKAGKNVYDITNIYSYLGDFLFQGEIISYESLIAPDIFEHVKDNKVKFSNSVFREFFFSLHYVESRINIVDKIQITDQIRSFIRQISDDPNFFDIDHHFEPEEQVVQPGPFIVGKADTLHIRHMKSGIRIDPHVVTVGQYNEFRKAARSSAVDKFEHPEQPEDWSHEPFFEKLKVENYYSDPSFSEHPAVCIGWWSAYACAQYFGKRLPTSFEWECTARGPFGHLFSWGDDFDLSRANCADYWAEEPLINYEDWREHFYSDGRRGGETTPIQKFKSNISVYGTYNMCGNVWEWTSSTDSSTDKAVICGGSYDNPFKAVQASSKGVYRTDGRSNVVGFRM